MSAAAGSGAERTTARAPRGTRRREPTPVVAPRRGWVAPAACMAVALIMRLWALSNQPWVTVDGTEYIRFAEVLARGESFRSIFPPGYPALIVLMKALAHDRVMAAALVSLVSGTLLPWPVWSLARRMMGERWALAAGLAVALHPELARFGAVTMSESAYLLALFAGLELVAGEKPLLAGLALGAAFAIRPEALLIAAALAVRELARVAQGRRSPAGLAWGALGLLALAVPSWLYFHATLGQWTLTPKLEDFHATVANWHEMEGRMAPPEPGGSVVWTVLRQYPAHALDHAGSLLKLWPAPLMVLSLAGLVLAPGPAAIPLLHLVLIPALGISVLTRFLLPALPALVLLAGVALDRAGRAGGARGTTWRVAAVTLALAGAVWCGAVNAPAILLPFDGNLEAQQKAGLWLGAHAEPDAVVMDRKPHVAFYAERTYAVIPDVPLDTLVDRMVRTHVRYLVLDEGVVKYYRRQLAPLMYLEEARRREPVELIYVGGEMRGYGLEILRVLQPGEARLGAPPVVDVPWMRHG